MSGFDPSSIDWSDPIEANRQLKQQLARLEAAQGDGNPEVGRGDGKEPEKYDDYDDYDNYGDEGYNSRLDLDPRYNDLVPDFNADTHVPNGDARSQAAINAYDRGHENYVGEFRDQVSEGSRDRRRNKGKQKGGKKNEGHIRRRVARANMTFDANKCRDIDRGNINLLQRLSSIHNRKTSTGGIVAKKRGPVRTKKKGSASINMRRKQDKIAEENRKFAARLQSVRGTKSLSKRSLKKHAVRSKKFAELGREVPGRKLSKRERRRREVEAREERESGWQ